MKEENLKLFIKRIANVEVPKDGSPEEAATNAISYLFCLPYDGEFFFENIRWNFSTLNPQEKWRFFHHFSKCEKDALRYGRSLQFSEIMRWFKSGYFFYRLKAINTNWNGSVFKYILGFSLAFLLKVMFGWFYCILLVAFLVFLLVYKVLVRIIESSVSTKQNEFIIRKIRENEIEDEKKWYESFFIKRGWLGPGRDKFF